MRQAPKRVRKSASVRRSAGVTTRRHRVNVSAAKLAELESRPDLSARELKQIEKDARFVFDRIESVSQLIGQLREIRQRTGLSLAEVDAKAGIGRSNLARLESLRVPNPTFDTLMRYARAIGVQLRLEVTKSSRRPAA